jgi:hypothetical protein
VLGEIQQLDGSLERAIEAYNLATDNCTASRPTYVPTCTS